MEAKKLKSLLQLQSLTSDPVGAAEASMYYNSTNDVVRVYANGIWADIGSGSGGSGGSGGINYIENTGAETDTTGWETYQDAAQATPEDGTGGSPTLTLTQNTTDPLIGSADFLLTKDAADRQGEGASYPFTIDNALQAQVVRVLFYYKAGGAFSFANGDLKVFLRDETNAVDIPLSINDFDGSGRYIGEFQASPDSVSYRLILHVATTNASAWTFNFDNVQVGPRETQTGADVGPVGEIVAMGIPSSSPPVDFLFCDGSAVSRTLYAELFAAIGTTFGVGDGSTTFNIPNTEGLFLRGAGSQDINGRSKGGQFLGDTQEDHFQGHRHGFSILEYGSGSSTNNGHGPHSGGTTGTYSGNTGAATTLSHGTPRYDDETYPSNLAVNYFIRFRSNQIKSTDFGSRVIAFSTKSIASGVPSSGSFDGTTNITWTPANFDTQSTVNSFDGTTFTVPESGWYDICAAVNITGTEAVNDFVLLALFVNGIKHSNSKSRVQSTSISSTPTYYVNKLKLNAGDLLTFRVETDIASPSFQVTSDITNHYWSLSKIQSPQTLLGGEVVAVKYRATAGQPVADNTDVVVNFDEKGYDSHNAVTTGSGWIFKAPLSGKYRVCVKLLYSSEAYTINDSLGIKAFVDGVLEDHIAEMHIHSSGTVAGDVQGSCEFDLIKGQELQLKTFNNSGGTHSLVGDGGRNWITISKVN